jgi:prophage regulatory protein
MQNDDTPMLLSIKSVTVMTSLSRTAINRYRSEGRFPAAVPLGDKRIAFVRSEIVRWIAERVALRAQADA